MNYLAAALIIPSADIVNGNQITRSINGSLSTLTYNTENHLTTVSGATSAGFVPATRAAFADECFGGCRQNLAK
ncbi:MAG: hypothetical protein JXA21_13910 [Anaerolineae bacterium]|nr:hypothetical protein [Anaerolineae bacterium]